MQNLKYKKTDLYDTLVEEYDIFQYNYDLLMFLTVLGYIQENPKQSNYSGNEDDGTQGNIAVSNLFDQDIYQIIAAAIAYQDTGTPEALVDRDQHMRVVGQYSAGGLEIAERKFGDVAGDPTDAMVNYIRELHENGGEEPGEDPILTEILKSFDEEMLRSEAD